MEEFIEKYGGYIIGFFAIPMIKLVIYMFHSTFKSFQHNKISKETRKPQLDNIRKEMMNWKNY